MGICDKRTTVARFLYEMVRCLSKKSLIGWNTLFNLWWLSAEHLSMDAVPEVSSKTRKHS